MARDQQEPLLRSSRPSSDHSSQQIEEEDDLLTGKHKLQAAQKSRATFWRELGLFVWAVLATAIVIVLAVLYQHAQASQSKPVSDGELDGSKPSGKRNLIFMVSDGMGPTSLSLTRSFQQFTQDLPADHHLTIDEHLIGSSRTRSTSSLITDSAAGATAFSCGKKSYNSAISVLPDHSACGTVLEAAKKAGYTTGLVVTTRITDATPACFASHVYTRDSEDLIAEQLLGFAHPLGPQVDLLLGGGSCHFHPNSTTASCREDSTDLFEKAKDAGWTHVPSEQEFKRLDSNNLPLPLLGLFAHTDIPYELDRSKQTEKYPSLSEMAAVALKGLTAATKDKDQGFFLMIEGSRIDHAGHSNDPVAQVHEVAEYDKTFSLVLDFLEHESVPGVAISTSDHETGGLATARQLHETYPEYAWYPSILANASSTASKVASDFKTHVGLHPVVKLDPLETYFKSQLLESALGIFDYTQEEVDKVMKTLDDDYKGQSVTWIIADIISRRAEVGWSTHGHTAVDVNVYASDAGVAKALIGNHENTEVGAFLRNYLDLDVEAITKELNEKGAEGWKGAEVGEATKLGLNDYHGEF